MLEVYEIHSEEEKPLKLLVGGVHGREWRTVSHILKELAEEEGKPHGRLVVIPSICKSKKRLSTLNEKYYETACGRRLLRLIRSYEPDIYIEVHCYRHSAYERLTSSKRLERLKVPQMVDFGERVLLGYVSPHLLSKTRLKLALVLEVPCGKGEGSRLKALEILRLAKNCRSGVNLLEELGEKYPEQARRAIELFGQWYKVGLVGA